MLNLYLSEALDPSKALVGSITISNPRPMREQSYGDVVPVAIVITDGQGSVSDLSGNNAYDCEVSIGVPNRVALIASTFTRSADADGDSHAGWTGNLDFSSTDILSIFNGSDVADCIIQVQLVDGSENSFTVGRIPVRVLKPILTGAEDSESSLTSGGFYALPADADTGSITGLDLSATPRVVIVSVRKPIGGDNISANVEGDPTTDGFNFTLSGAPPDTGYRLEYVFLY